MFTLPNSFKSLSLICGIPIRLCHFGMCELNNRQKSSKLCEKSEYTWILHKYTEIQREYNKDGTKRESPIFPEGEGKYKWKLILYPNYILRTLDFMSLFLCPATELQDEITVEFTLSLRNNKNDLIVQKFLHACFGDQSILHGVSKLIRNVELIKLINEDDILQIHTVVFVEVPTLQPDTISTPRINSFMKLSRDLENMFASSEFKDFTIKFNDKTEMTVHRSILAARSPVFAAMFRHNLSENKVGFTEIVDIDKTTLMQLLTFIYTGKTKHLSLEEAINLLLAADKYEVTDLAEHCSEVMKGNITESSAMDVLILAEVHSVSELKKAAFEYILANPQNFSDRKCLERVEKYSSLQIEFSSKMIVVLREKLGYI